MERALHAPIPYSAWTAIQTPGQLVSAGPREVDMSSLQIQLEVRAVGSGGSTPSQKWFAVRCGGGPVHPVRMRWEDGWRGDVEHLANGRESTAVVKRLGKRLMRLVASTGWPKEAVRIREAKQQGDKVLLSLVSDSPEILSLPWEALPVGDGGVPLGQLLEGQTAEEPQHLLPIALAVQGLVPHHQAEAPVGGRPVDLVDAGVAQVATVEVFDGVETIRVGRDHPIEEGQLLLPGDPSRHPGEVAGDRLVVDPLHDGIDVVATDGPESHAISRST